MKSHSISDDTEIVLKDIEWLDGAKDHARYKDIGDVFAGKKWDVISVDAPMGTSRKGKKIYNRVDVVDYLPRILKEDFVIVFDDAGRCGERNTIRKVMHTLKSHGIICFWGYYRGTSDCEVIASEKYRFLCSL